MARRKTHEPKAIDEGVLFEALKDNLSPQAIAGIAAYLVARPTAGPNASVNKELHWFVDQLVDLVGGDEAFNRLCEELEL